MFNQKNGTRYPSFLNAVVAIGPLFPDDLGDSVDSGKVYRTCTSSNPGTPKVGTREGNEVPVAFVGVRQHAETIVGGTGVGGVGSSSTALALGSPHELQLREKQPPLSVVLVLDRRVGTKRLVAEDEGIEEFPAVDLGWHVREVLESSVVHETLINYRL